MNQIMGMMKTGAESNNPECHRIVKRAVTSDPLLDSFCSILIFEVSEI